MLVVAGLWDETIPPGAVPFRSFTLVTTEPNQLLRDIGHHRAPVILGPDQFSTWLEGSAEAAQAIIAPPTDGSLSAQRVTTRVNNPGYQEEDLLEPAD